MENSRSFEAWALGVHKPIGKTGRWVAASAWQAKEVGVGEPIVPARQKTTTHHESDNWRAGVAAIRGVLEDFADTPGAILAGASLAIFVSDKVLAGAAGGLSKRNSHRDLWDKVDAVAARLAGEGVSIRFEARPDDHVFRKLRRLASEGCDARIAAESQGQTFPRREA